MKKQVYLDHAATTPLASEAFSAMKPYLTDKFGNASSLHALGIESKKALIKSREQVAGVLGCRDKEIIFTASGTEANNLAIKGVADPTSLKLRRAGDSGGHIITSVIEHHAVLETIQYLETQGVAVTYLPVDRSGLVSASDLVRALRHDTFLVSIMYANNEIGTVHPISEIGGLIKKRQPNTLFHVDAVQAPGLLELNVEKLRCDLLSLSGHKFYGPKGTGVLYVRRGTKLVPQILGGGQEEGLRSGTENIPGIVGLATALVNAEKNRVREVLRLTKLRNWLVSAIREKIPQAVFTGHPSERLANNVSFCFPGLEGEALVMRLSERGFACSAGSACATGSFAASHVLLALGISRDAALGSLRVSLGKTTRLGDLEAFLEVLIEEVEKTSKF